jgi:hypothetical protein
MQAVCIQVCRDGKANVYYDESCIGKTFDIDPLDPIATYFEFPAGTEKYDKKEGLVKQVAGQQARLPADVVIKREPRNKK